MQHLRARKRRSGLHRIVRVRPTRHHIAALARDRGVDHGSKTFLGPIIEDVEDPQPPAIGKLVMHEVDGSAGVRTGHDQKRRPRPGGPFAPPSLLHGQALFAVERAGCASRSPPVFPGKRTCRRHSRTAAPRPRGLACVFAALCHQGDSCGSEPRTGLPAEHGTPAARSCHGFPRDGRQRSAWRRASPFSTDKAFQRGVVEHRIGKQPLQLGVLASSSAFSRRASDTSMPPYFAFHA